MKIYIIYTLLLCCTVLFLRRRHYSRPGTIKPTSNKYSIFGLVVMPYLTLVNSSCKSFTKTCSLQMPSLISARGSICC